MSRWPRVRVPSRVVRLYVSWNTICSRTSVGRGLAKHAGSRGFESRREQLGRATVAQSGRAPKPALPYKFDRVRWWTLVRKVEPYLLYRGWLGVQIPPVVAAVLFLCVQSFLLLRVVTAASSPGANTLVKPRQLNLAERLTQATVTVRCHRGPERAVFPSV